MNCQTCSKQPATIHVTEIHYAHSHPPVQTDALSPPGGIGGVPSTSSPAIEQKHICEECAQGMALPYAPVASSKNALDIWKLLQNSARRARQEGSLACPDCGMTLADFRAKGRLGCPKDYVVFRAHLRPLLQRVHNADAHLGRLPDIEGAEGADASVCKEQRKRRSQLIALRTQLERAIAAEAYENAAQLRDEIKELETGDGSSG
jgi:protein arginine kinase activator